MTDCNPAHPKPVKKKKKLKVKKSKLQKSKENPRSGFWERKANEQWRKMIKLDGRCAINKNCAGGLEAHHLITRANKPMKHELMNGIALCSKHHKWDRELSAHTGPVAFSEWLRINRPHQYEFALKNRFYTGEKANYQERYENIKQLLEDK